MTFWIRCTQCGSDRDLSHFGDAIERVANFLRDHTDHEQPMTVRCEKCKGLCDLPDRKLRLEAIHAFIKKHVEQHPDRLREENL